MKTFTYAIILAALAAVYIPALEAQAAEANKEGEVAWFTDFEEAKKAAAKTKRPILMDFSGSDWCGWCIKLDKEVFSQAEFKKYADKNLIMFLADFPRRTKQPENLKAQNNKLAEQYGVRGFPTVIVLNSKGKLVANTGYRKGGAKAYVKHLKDLLK